ncbi:MAG: hypothetical protein KDE27_04895 [Planctomycetes bacterium]|nr:hypothetical protein [Planctomycetota bacterium]
MPILYVDIVDACHLRCPTCPKGERLLPNSAARMPLPDFRRIVAKARAEQYTYVGLYSWTEPLLCPDVASYVAVVKAAGLRSQLSSTLSLANIEPRLGAAFAAGLDHLIVSISGITPAVYERNHRGGRLDRVLHNLEFVAAERHAGRTNARLQLRFLEFDYNRDERPALEQLAADLGFEFEVVTGQGHPDMDVRHYSGESLLFERITRFDPERRHERAGEVCPLIMDTLAVDCRGEIYLCCAYPYYPFLRIGRYLDLDADEILIRRHSHACCTGCAFPRRAITEPERARLRSAFDTRLGTPAANGAAAVETAARPAPLLGRVARALAAWAGR